MPWARWRRGEEATHWCHACVVSLGLIDEAIQIDQSETTPLTLGPLFDWADSQAIITPVRVGLVDISGQLASRLVSDPSLIHSLSPSQFEEFICGRLYSMGFEPRQVSRTNQRDGGIDIIFWPRRTDVFPFLGAAQVKHHNQISKRQGVGSVRDFAGTIAGHPFNMGLLITNTSFTPDAEWFAREKAKLLKLRGFGDIRRWLAGDFSSDEEWREIPEAIEVCPGLVIPLRPRRLGLR